MKAKVDAVVANYVMKGELRMSKIKDTFNKEAAAAKTAKEVEVAMLKAKTASEVATADIEKALKGAVKPLNGNYDLSKSKAKIETALGAGRAEVRLNSARYSSKIESRDFDAKM